MLPARRTTAPDDIQQKRNPGSDAPHTALSAFSGSGERVVARIELGELGEGVERDRTSPWLPEQRARSTRTAVVEAETNLVMCRINNELRRRLTTDFAWVLVHTFEYFIETFTKVFGYPHEKCLALALQIHTAGRGIVWSGALEVAELKRDQLRSAGPDFYAAEKVDCPLGVTIELLPG